MIVGSCSFVFHTWHSGSVGSVTALWIGLAHPYQGQQYFFSFVILGKMPFVNNKDFIHCFMYDSQNKRELKKPEEIL